MTRTVLKHLLSSRHPARHCLAEHSLQPDCIIDNRFTDKETEAQKGLGLHEVNNEFWTTVCLSPSESGNFTWNQDSV